MPDNIQVQRVICEGGLDTTENHLLLSQEAPGAATRLINYEVAPSGGYRRINGFTKFDDTYYNVDNAAAEGKILGIAVYTKADGTYEYFAARKQQSGATYKWYKFGGGGWAAVTTGVTHTYSSAITRIRHVQVNYDGTPVICFVDGVNKALLYDGTNWAEIDSTNTGANFANAGGAQAIDAPKYVAEYYNHLFLANESGDEQIIAHSAPTAPYDFTSANGGGQVIAGFDIQQIRAFRDNLYVFGRERIKKVTVDSSANFVINDVTTNIGCIASDSVLEVNSNLMFLAPDGFRPIAGTDRIGDIELTLLSSNIRNAINNVTNLYDLQETFHGVTIRKKGQVRYFYGGESDSGIIGGIRYNRNGQTSWEWGLLNGWSPSVMTSAIVDGDEVILHGDYSGNIYYQEMGNSFDGQDIVSIYSPPFLDQGYPDIRKTYRHFKIFLRPEGAGTMYLTLKYDWYDPNQILPDQYDMTISAPPVVYGGLGVEYGGTGITYGGGSRPVIYQNIEGSAYSMRPTFVTVGTDAPHIIQGFTYQFTPEGFL